MVRGAGVVGNDYKFNGLELVTDKREYAPGDKVKLLVNTDTIDGTVLLFLRPTNGVYLPPKVIRLKGKSVVEEIAVVQKDMPNFFIEAMTVHGGKVHQEMREVVVPPEKRVLNVEVLPSAAEYKPGEKATVKVKVTDFFGKPFAGTTVLSVYDRSVEYISGGSNVPEIREFFWKWRRSHYPQNENSLTRGSGNLLKPNQTGMSDLGIFGHSVVEEFGARWTARPAGEAAASAGRGGREGRQRDGGAAGGHGAPMDARRQGRAEGRGPARTLGKAQGEERAGDEQAGGRAGQARRRADGAAQLRRHGVLEGQARDRQGRPRRGHLHHARAVDRLEGQGLGAGPRHQGRPGRGRGRRRRRTSCSASRPRASSPRRTRSSCPPTSTTT